ncbi:MAG: hypothetical protein NVSMB6_07860 [Burkholderiaceae bacterium]
MEKLNKALNDVLADPGVRSSLATGGGLSVLAGSPDQMGRLVHDELVKWKEVSQKAHIQVE